MISFVKKWKWTIPLFVLVDNIAVCIGHWATNIGSKYLERVFLVFWFTNLTETFPDTGRCHMIYWCFLMVCHLSFSLNFALCEHYICKHSIYMHPPLLQTFQKQSWTFQLTSHEPMFLIFLNRKNSFEKILLKLERKLIELGFATKTFDTPCQFLQLP